MGILSWIIVGLVAGWLTGEVMRESGFGLAGDLITGIVGALIGGSLATALFGIVDPFNGFYVPTLILAFFGSVLLITLLKLLRGARV